MKSPSNAPDRPRSEDVRYFGQRPSQEWQETACATATRASARPPLLRSPPGRLSELSQHSPEAVGVTEPHGTTTDKHADGRFLQDKPPKDGEPQSKTKAKVATSPAEEERLTRIKDAVSSKLLQQQQHKRNSYGPSTSGTKRVSPIKEEGAIPVSPSLNAAFASPVDFGSRSQSTVSTESAESIKTVRASVFATPTGEKPLRTPSYPFPYVPGTPRTWSSGFHQPFTSLSPTVSGNRLDGDETPGKTSISMLSDESTPGSNPNDFAPAGADLPLMHDPRFPTPNLYDMVLQLNAEPGLEPWWATVTNLLHDHFKAERATLVQPLDPTDIENAPWGQKATFSMNGREEFVPHRTVLEQTTQATGAQRPALRLREPSMETSWDVRMAKLHPERLRPRLESRHSYAGHGRETRDVPSDASSNPQARPPGPQRSVTHAAGVDCDVGPGGLPTQRLPSTSSFRHVSLSDLEFSSIAGGADAGPYAEVYPILHALDHEIHPLIEASGVNRVLDRGRVVAVTRDYVAGSSGSSNGNALSPVPNESVGVADETPKDASKSSSLRHLSNYRNVFATDNTFDIRKAYEEYEQYPSSPWTQSPAPSPAIQADEDTNPFFASEEQQIEDSFNPTGTPKDYSQFGQVEAIGVDRASTVIHIPLIHPTLSQPMQSLRPLSETTERSRKPQRSGTLDAERKAPIAILSVLSNNVPYPHNLTQCIKLLGPHLATSLALAQQYSHSHVQPLSIRHRRTASGHVVSNAPMTIEPTSLEDIITAELEEAPGSVSGSITSPSDYSGRSRHSPAGSIVGTPNWDPVTHGWTSSRSAAGTPAIGGIEMVDNYFEAKKRFGQRSMSHTSAQATPARPAKKPSFGGDDDIRTPLSEQKKRRSIKEERSPLREAQSKDHLEQARADMMSPQWPAIRHAVSQMAEPQSGRHHSRLHSYGADFESSFGPLATPAGLHAVATGVGGHARKPSYSEDMPPPSERLLRTIIDSVPVQIFTAKPDSGQLSWVNSKFLIYRGQEARQVLNEPWQAIHPDDRTDFLASWNRSLRTAQQLQQKVRLERFDGSFRWFYVRAAPLKDKRQKIVHWIGTMMDFHEQHLAELNAARQQETAASEAKYRALANSSPQIVFAVNKTKGIIFCNSQWLHYSGQTEAQALGVGFMDHVHPDDLAKCRLPTFDEESGQATNVPTSVPPEPKRTASVSAASSGGSSETEKDVSSAESSSPVTQMPPQRQLSELASTGILKVTRDADGRPSYSTEVRLRNKEGNFRWHLVRVLLAEPLISHEQEEDTWYGTCTDINDHKALERDLKETMDEKSRFLSNMSHEIRTPLNGITGMVNFLIDSNLTAEQMEHVNIIRASTEGLRGLINDILDLSKAEAGMIQLNMEWLYVRALIEEVNDLTSAMAIDKGLELNYLVNENMPQQIKGDRFRIRQILLNIVGNAIKFTQVGEVFIRCDALPDEDGRLGKDEMYIQFEVIDTGRGFTEKEAEYLFKRFSQIDGSSTRQHGGTGLGLVISRQLAQLHGGDISAKGVPGKGSTFAFFIKTALPSEDDQPPPPPVTPGGASIPILPITPGPAPAPTAIPKAFKTAAVPLSGENPPRASPKFALETTQTPSPFVSPDAGRESPSVSSASSDPSLRSNPRTSSLRSERSSASSFVPDISFTSPMKLVLPPEAKTGSAGRQSTSMDSNETTKPSNEIDPPSAVSSVQLAVPAKVISPPTIFSILVISTFKYSREATVQHIDQTLPKNVPHQITAREHLDECQKMLGGDDPVIFTHIVVVLNDAEGIIALMDQVFTSPSHSSTMVIIITDLNQRRKIIEQAPNFDYDALSAARRLRFVFKPIKPSRFAVIFDPQKEREMSTDRNQDSAQQVALNQKQVFEELSRRLGNTDKRVLLVEDNRVNQMVILKFLAKVSIAVETVLDGVQCTEKVFAQPHGYYSIVLCDLHMPNKDGYQTCKEIRQWERDNKYPYSPVIALSANVLGDVYQKCVEAGFNSYLAKPVDFKELSTALMRFLDPVDPSRPVEFMKAKAKKGVSR